MKVNGMKYKQKCTGANSGLAIFFYWGLTRLNEALFFVSNFVVADSLVLRNRQLLVAANRYASL